MARKKFNIHYDAVLKRYRASCPHCSYFAVRAKSEAAEHVLSQHIAYAHDGKGES